jgi:hypothetical protein
MDSEFWPVHSIVAPTERISSTSVSMSRMRGTFSRYTGLCEIRAAATMGSAAFLFPEGRMEPLRGLPPSTTN